MLTRFDLLEFNLHPMAQDMSDLAKDYDEIMERMNQLGISADDFGKQAISEHGDMVISVVQGKYWGPGYLAMVTRLSDGEVIAMGERLTAEEVDAMINWMEQQA